MPSTSSWLSSSSSSKLDADAAAASAVVSAPPEKEREWGRPSVVVRRGRNLVFTFLVWVVSRELPLLPSEQKKTQTASGIDLHAAQPIHLWDRIGGRPKQQKQQHIPGNQSCPRLNCDCSKTKSCALSHPRSVMTSISNFRPEEPSSRTVSSTIPQHCIPTREASFS